MVNKIPAGRLADDALECRINGAEAALSVPPSRTLLTVLCDDLRLRGAAVPCEIGRCGACVVLIDGEPMNACLLMAYQCKGKSITTIEGIAWSELYPIQQAFLEEGGYQCGRCTPGMIVSVKALLAAHPDPDPEQINEALSGNLCRCIGYGNLIRSVKRAAKLGKVSI